MWPLGILAAVLCAVDLVHGTECNPCDVYINPTKIFGMCALKLDSSLWSDKFASCMRLRLSGHFQDIMDDFQNVVDICSANGIELDIDFTVCPAVTSVSECSICSRLLMTGDGVKDCAQKMSPIIWGSLITDCLNYENIGDKTGLDDLMNNLKALCAAKGDDIEITCLPPAYSSVKPISQSTTGIPTGTYGSTPSGACGRCSFAGQSCFEAISGQLQQSIVADCNAAVSDEAAYEQLLDNLAIVCAGKGTAPLEATPCTTDSPVTNIHPVSYTTSDIPTVGVCGPCNFGGHPCFESLSSKIQHSVVADCNAVVNNEDAYEQLLNNLALVCAGKGKDPLVAIVCGSSVSPSTGTTSNDVNPPATEIKPVSHSTPGLPTGVASTPSGICGPCKFAGHPCFEAISTQLQQSIVTECNAVANDQDAYDKLLSNLALICAAKGKDPLDAVPCVPTEPPYTGTTSNGINPTEPVSSIEPVSFSTMEPPTDIVPPESCGPCTFAGQSCFESISAQLQDALLSDCNAKADTPESYTALLENLALICSTKGLDSLTPATCG